MFKLFLYLCICFLSYNELMTSEIILSGRQEEKKRTLDLDIEQVKVKGTYLVPKGAQLIIRGKGVLASAEKERIGRIICDGYLTLGEVHHQPHDLNNLVKIVNDRVTFVFNEKYSKLKAHGIELENFKMNFHHGRAKWTRCVFSGEQTKVVLFTTFEGQQMFSECAFSNGYFDCRLKPEVTQKHVFLKQCIFYGESSIHVYALWSMRSCDIYNNPFLLDKLVFDRSPVLLFKQYFSNREACLQVVKALQEKEVALKYISVKKPFNKKLGLNLKYDSVVTTGK